MTTPRVFSFLGASLTAKQWLYVGAAVLIAALAIFGAGFGIGWGGGSSSATKEAAETARKLAEEVAKEREGRLKALNAANARNRALERDFDQRVADALAKYQHEEGREQAVDARTVTDLRAGRDVMRLPVRTCSAAVASAAEAAGARADAEARAELAPATSAALYGIAADGDAAIRQLTGLQAWAEEAVRLCGPPPTPSEKSP